MPATRHTRTGDQRPELWDLLDQARAGDRDAFGRFYTATSPTIYGLIYRRVLGDRDAAADVLSEVYLAAWRTLPGIRRRAESPLAWLATIARCKVIDRHRAQSRRPCVAVGSADDLADTWTPDGLLLTTRSAEQHTLDRATAREVWQHAEQLAPDQHRVLRARYWFGMSVTDTAAAIGRTAAETRQLQYRALENLRAQLRGTTLDPAMAAA
ncbi:RNA polymerase sigma factor [Micromonospora sp. RP3T]|uniref:RNA polymerase sigma factor n=1 Tax=Micromonospora sp. RP3T TaxID=2135446 RepID=UPI003D763D86